MTTTLVTQFSDCIYGILNLLSLAHFQTACSLGFTRSCGWITAMQTLCHFTGENAWSMGNYNNIFNSSEIPSEAFALVTVRKQ